MMLIDKDIHDRYTSNIITPNPTNLKGGICELNEDTTHKLIEVATKLSFTSLYANLLVSLYKDGTLNRLSINIDPDIVEKIRYFLVNRYIIKAKDNGDEYTKYKTWVNSIYGKELRNESLKLFDVYHQYMKQYIDDIKNANKYSWLYTDTDTMLFAGEVNDINIPHQILPYSKDRIDFLYIERKKRYIEYSKDTDLKAKGYTKKYYPHEIISLIKNKIRERKLDDILG